MTFAPIEDNQGGTLTLSRGDNGAWWLTVEDDSYSQCGEFALSLTSMRRLFAQLVILIEEAEG